MEGGITSFGTSMIEIKKNVSLAPYTSWLIGGPADHFCLPSQVDELKEAWSWALQNQQPVTWFGGGTNILISDRGIRGLTLGLKRFSKIETEVKDDHLWIRCLSGTAKSELLKLFLRHQLSPALFMAGLPGDVGGGLVMNAGVAEAFSPREFGELVHSFEVLSEVSGELKSKTYQHADVNWSYRHCQGWGPGIITHVTLKWPLKSDTSILEKVKEANRTRLAKQPLDKPSCGSVFINPVGHKAAQLIDSCQLKGHRIGDAQVSTKHCNFIVNLGTATAQDTWDLILFVQKTVKEKTGVQLNTEVVRVGDWSGI